MQRFDLYTHAHKAVRSLYFEAVLALARTDFEGEPELPSLAASLRGAVRFARRQAEHEEGEIHPFLHALAPELAADLEAAHGKLEGLGRKLDAELLRLERAGDPERAALGRRVRDTLDQLVGEELEHLRLEETRASRVLWAHLCDAELREVQARILASMEPAELGDWLAEMLRAGNARERLELMDCVGATLSAARATAEVEA